MILLGERVLSGKLKFHMLFLEPEIKTEYEEDDNDSFIGLKMEEAKEFSTLGCVYWED